MKQEYNILLFGESGAGKSTTINALTNYLRFQSFEAAIEGDFVHKIPSKIHLFDPKTYKPLVIEDGGDDSNERFNDAGQSVTQSPKSYSFEFEDKKITIIDTPGMGDTRGIETDKQNLAKILDYLKTWNQTLHAIFFLIKTNTTRKTAAFRYCLNELLSLLSREHAQTNLVFCFTFSRNSLYGPGDGYDTLKGVLRDNQNSEGQVEIQLKNGGNCYFIDNEAYHYLVARKNGYPFTVTKEKSYKESWLNSSASIKQMLTHITNLSPFSPNQIFTLLEARKLLPQLEEPMEKLITEIDTRVDKIEVEKEKLQNFQNEGKLKDANALEQMIGQMLKVAEECEGELSLIKDFVIKLAFYLIEHSNSTCEKLIAPYMQLLSPDSPTQIKQFVTTTRTQFVQNQIPKIDAKEIQIFEQQLVGLKHQGSYFKKIIEKIKGSVPEPSLSPTRAAPPKPPMPTSPPVLPIPTSPIRVFPVPTSPVNTQKLMDKLILNNPNNIAPPELSNNKIKSPIPEPTLSPTRTATPKPPMPTSPPPVLPVQTSPVRVVPVPTSPVLVLSDPNYAVITPQVKTPPVATFPGPILPVSPPPLKTPPVPTFPLPSIPVPTSLVPKTKPTEQDMNNNLEPQYTSNIEALRLQRDEESRRTDQLVMKPTLFDFCMPTKQRNNSRRLKIQQQQLRQQASISSTRSRNHNPNYRNSTVSSQTGKPRRQKLMIEVMIDGFANMFKSKS